MLIGGKNRVTQALRRLLFNTATVASWHMPTATATDWTAIEKAAISGVSYPKLAARFGVTLAAVKKQASRGKWPVPARIMRRARELSPNVTGEAVTIAAR